jgi:hypothetical protein
MPGGRPRYVPSDNDRALVRNMAAAGLSHESIQRCLPTGPKIETFRKVFRIELETSKDIVTAKAISKLITKIDAGDLGAICFWLKCKAGFVDRQSVDNRLVDKDGDDREVNITVEYIRAPRPE